MSSLPKEEVDGVKMSEKKFSTKTKETFKLKLKAMRCRIKQKRREFLQMSSFNALTTTYLEKHYDLLKVSEVKQNVKDVDSLSIEISFSRNQANLEQNSKNSSRTSTPIFSKKLIAKKKLVRRSSKKQRYSIRADARNSTILIQSSKSNKKTIDKHSIYLSKFLSKTDERVKSRRFEGLKFFDFKQNDICNYVHSSLNSCSQCNFYENNHLNCEEIFIHNTENSIVPCRFEEFGDFKVWYV